MANALTPEQKRAAKEELRQKITQKRKAPFLYNDLRVSYAAK